MTNLAQLTDKTENFKYVIVAAGHFSYPNIPYISGIQKFKGRIVHSHDVRTFDEFKDRKSVDQVEVDKDVNRLLVVNNVVVLDDL